MRRGPGASTEGRKCDILSGSEPACFGVPFALFVWNVRCDVDTSDVALFFTYTSYLLLITYISPCLLP